MNTMPLVSVLMPAFNSELYIAEAIESILNQTYSNIELIIFDDGSTDNTRAVIEKYQDPRILKIFSNKNYGVVRARNDMIDKASGKYIALMDSDDIADPIRLKYQVMQLELGEFDVIGSAQLVLNQETGRIKKSKDKYTDSDIRALLSVYCTLCNSSITVRSEILKEFKYDENFPVAEDYFLWARIAAAGYRFKNLKERLITYRVYPQQSSLLSKEKFHLASILVRSKYLEMLGIAEKFTPRPMQFHLRLKFGVGLIWALNQHFGDVSTRANCEIYSRFQFRKNVALSLIQRLERNIIVLCCYAFSRLLKSRTS